LDIEMTYKAPLKDMLFCMKEIAGLHTVTSMPKFKEFDGDTADAILEECAKLCENVWAPLNKLGDTAPSSWHDGAVKSTAGFKDAFSQFVDGGWQGLQHPERFGGQGIPKVIGTACVEMMNSANISLALCPQLTDGAIEAFLTAGSQDQLTAYLPNMISGRWTGTMNLTEPQAGSDLSQVRSRALPQGDGTYRIFGTKIFITYGDHDLAENIIHLVLARATDAPEGVKGISLFVVPKYMIGADGTLGARNDVLCVSIEHKLGIKASPTAVLQFGDNGGAVGYLVGEENRGLEYMFAMMNVERFSTGVQGFSLGERAYQMAAQYAKDRVQSRPVDGSIGRSVAIIHHPDVKRMLMTMRAVTEGCRAMAFVASAAYDHSRNHPDQAERTESATLFEFLVPLVKAFSTEMALETTSLGIQVHGGMGFIEETGAAQFHRDARILAIYEGTTGIQANDLVGRKTLRDGGRTARRIAGMVAETESRLVSTGSDAAGAIQRRLKASREAFLETVDFILRNGKDDPNIVYAGSVPYLMLAGTLVAGWQMARAFLIAEERLAAGIDPDFMRAKIATAMFFADHLLPRTGSLRDAVVEGGPSVLAMPLDSF
jgi:3-(methylthio)propanoyl-CoA dehydrogenase